MKNCDVYKYKDLQRALDDCEHDIIWLLQHGYPDKTLQQVVDGIELLNQQRQGILKALLEHLWLHSRSRSAHAIAWQAVRERYGLAVPRRGGQRPTERLRRALETGREYD